MKTEGHLIMLTCDQEGCTNATEFFAHNKRTAWLELRQAGWLVVDNSEEATCDQCHDKIRTARKTRGLKP